MSPVYNGELLIQLLVDRLILVLSPLTESYEIILVDDGSNDNSVAILKSLSKLDNRLKAIILTKNHGQHVAIKAGLDNCRGEWIVVMDCDLQDEPEAIHNLFITATSGYDAVFAHRKKKYDAWNWYKGIPYSKCLAALERHLYLLKAGQDFDYETGLHNGAAIRCCAAMLITYTLEERKDLDDRIPMSETNQELMNKMAQGLSIKQLLSTNNE